MHRDTPENVGISTHEASCSADGNQSSGSAPITEMTAADAPTPMPRNDAINARWTKKGCNNCAICATRTAINATSWTRWVRSNGHNRA